MTRYITLEGRKFEIDCLSSEDLHIYQQACQYLSQRPEWADFANFWYKLVVNLYGETPEITEKPIYKICQDLECRLGIEQGFIRPVEDEEYDQVILPNIVRFFSDKGKLLIVFSAVDSIKLEIDRDLVDCYVYIIDDKGILPFSYSFRHTPYPYSHLLHEELSDLESIGYLRAASPVSITQAGKEWVDREGTKHPGLHRVQEKIAQEISWVRSCIGDRYSLFGLYYAMITRS